MERGRLGWSEGRRAYCIGGANSKAEAEILAYLGQQKLPPGAHAGIEDTAQLMFLDRAQKWVRRDKLAAADQASGGDGDPRRATPELGKIRPNTQVIYAGARIYYMWGNQQK